MKVVCLKTDGGIHSFEMDHTNVNLFFNNEKYGICGAINDQFIIGLGLIGRDKEENIFSVKYPNFFDNTHGDILLVGSDSSGEACDVNMETICKLFSENNKDL